MSTKHICIPYWLFFLQRYNLLATSKREGDKLRWGNTKTKNNKGNSQKEKEKENEMKQHRETEKTKI